MSKFSGDRAYQAFRILQVAFVIAPILAGFDKFFYMLANWSSYLSPMALQLIDGHDYAFLPLSESLRLLRDSVSYSDLKSLPMPFQYGFC